MSFLIYLSNIFAKDMTDKITFDNLPEAILELHRKVDILLSQCQNKQPVEQDKLLTIEQLIDFLPEKPAKQTIYGWVNDRHIPFEKHGKRLYFRQSNIDGWLSKGRMA
jgi:hypothetical protein